MKEQAPVWKNELGTVKTLYGGDKELGRWWGMSGSSNNDETNTDEEDGRRDKRETEKKTIRNVVCRDEYECTG